MASGDPGSLVLTLHNASTSLSNWSTTMTSDDDDYDALLFMLNFDDGDGRTSTVVTISNLIDRYVAPLVVVLGLVGNIISLVVFSERTMQRRSSSVYLAALSAVDVAFLTCVLLSWTAQTRFDLYAINGLCQAFTYVTYVSSFLGVWYVVGFTVERYVAVHYPLRRQSLCTAAKARRSVGALALFGAVSYSFGAWTSGVTVINPPNYRVCGPMMRYAIALSVVHTIDTIVTLILPFIIITVLNLCIAVTVVRWNRTRRAMSQHSVHCLVAADRIHRHASVAIVPVEPRRPRTQRLSTASGVVGSRTCTNPGATATTTTTTTRNGDQFRVTKLLLTVSAAFLLLNLPRHAVRTYSLLVDLFPPYIPPSPVFLVYQKLFQVVYYAQFSVNIVLYATIGRSNFRAALYRIARRTKRRLLNAFASVRLTVAAIRWYPGCCRATVAEVDIQIDRIDATSTAEQQL